MINVSVVVLVYNTEFYIDRCVRSLLKQTLDKMEFIFINDCTPDKSMSILKSVLDDYPHRKEQVCIVNNEVNKGSAYCRNLGVSYAHGEYLIFCDSDDWVDTDAYEQMYLEARKNNSDILLTDYFLNYVDKERCVKQHDYSIGKNYVKAMLEGHLHGSTCNKLVKRSLYTEYDINYEQDINLWEDMLINVKLFSVARKITYMPVAFYHYWRANDLSYTHSKNKEVIYDQHKVVLILEDLLRDYGFLPEFNSSFCLLKLRVKTYLLMHADCDQELKSLTPLYPEANGYIPKCDNISFVWKILLYFSSYNYVTVSKLIIFFGNILKTIKYRRMISL